MAKNKNPILKSFGNVDILEKTVEHIEKKSPVTILCFLSQCLCYDVAKYVVLLMLLDANNKLTFDNLDMRNLNFSSCVFTKININESDFNNAIFNNVDISMARITKSFFTNVKLTNANFNSSSITNSGFNSAIIINSNFEDVYLNSSDMTNATINNTNFLGAYFVSVCLQNVVFDNHTNLDDVVFKDCNSRGANCGVPKINCDTAIETSGVELSGGGFSSNATATRFVFVNNK